MIRWLNQFRDRRVLKQGDVRVHCFHRRWPKDEWEATAKYEDYQVTGHGATAEKAKEDWCARVLVEAAIRSTGHG